jgi:hypothetical protein
MVFFRITAVKLQSYIELTGWAVPVRYQLSFYIPEDDILHSHSRENFTLTDTDLIFSKERN